MRPAILLLLLPLSASADCLVRVGAYDRGGPAHAHTFTLVERGNERLFISWMPAGRLNLLAGPVPGRNWTLTETLNHANAIGARVRWEPLFVASDEFWERFKAQVILLESGAVLYVALNERHHPGACNCIGACLWTTGSRPPTHLKYGHRVSPDVVKHLRKHR